MNFKILLTLSALSLGVSPAALAGGTNNWGTTSDVLALGLPALAAGAAWAQNDTEGIKELTYSLGSTYAAAMVLKKVFTLHVLMAQITRDFLQATPPWRLQPRALWTNAMALK